MSAPLKKRALQREEENSESESSEDEFQNEFVSNEEIQVDFEGRNPIDSDFHGIKQLLNQLFLKAEINLSDLADLIIKQNYVGSVITCANEESDDDDDDISEACSIFGITTMLNISEKQNMECIIQLRHLLLELANQHATDQVNNFLRSLLENDSRPVGLLINERYINIPAKITVPLLEHLIQEINRAANKKMAFTFDYIIMICKLYKADKSSKKSKKNKNQQPSILWSNPEEEVLNELAEFSFEFSVKDKSDSGQWNEDDETLVPYRKIIIFPAKKLDEIFEKIKDCVN